MTMVLEAGGEDLRIDGDRYEIICGLPALEPVKRALEQHSIPTLLAELSMIPKNSIKLEGKEAEQMVHLMDALEDHDDIQKVWANFDIADEVMAQMAAG
jgi:transcriptional/translational regulatory protein YebC/TACO1